MKITLLSILPVFALCLFSCIDEFSTKHFKLDDSIRYAYKKHDVLHYRSADRSIYLTVDSVVNGTYDESTGGTCGKGPHLYAEFQYIYLTAAGDTVQYYIKDDIDDCYGSPFSFSNSKIEIIKGFQYSGPDGGMKACTSVRWYDSLSISINKNTQYSESMMLGNKTFNNVYSFSNENADSCSLQSTTTCYFTQKEGIVGFSKKSGELFTLQIN